MRGVRHPSGAGGLERIWDGYDLAWPGRRLKGLAQEAAEREASVWEEPTEEDLARAADVLGWDEYGDW